MSGRPTLARSASEGKCQCRSDAAAGSLEARFRGAEEDVPLALELVMELRGGEVINADFDPLGIGHRHAETGTILLPEAHEDGLKLRGQ